MSEGHNGVQSEDLSHCENEKEKKEDICGNICNGEHFSINSNLLTTNLTHLDLSNCGLSQFPSDLPNSDSIVEIDLSKNQLEDLPDSFICIKKLRVLNLSNNCISKVPNALYKGLTLIKSLNLSGNKLVTFQKPPSCLAHLQCLDLSSNRLLAPPPWLIEEIPSSLEIIDLSANPCFQLCPACPEVHENLWRIPTVADNIKTLKIRSCGFRGGINERYLGYFSHISQLDISNIWKEKDPMNFVTDISYIPVSVTELAMNGVGLACLPKGVSSLPNLRSLDVSKNFIQWFPPAMKNLKNLVILRAESSKIFLLPPELNELPAMRELYLSGNELSSCDGFEDLVTLEVLDLYGNQFITVPKFENLSRLRALDFCQNYIEPPKLIMLGKRLCSYESLRECLRTKYLLMKNERVNGAKDFPVVPESIDNNSESLSDFEDFVDAEDEVTSNNGDSHTSGINGEQREREVWDLDSDDNYDPNDFSRNMPWMIQRDSPADSLTGELPYEVKRHPHYFAPYRPITPVILPDDDLPPPVEGQFDDD